jgi:oxygen-dependent protoporphyrinogen oxidase
MKRVAIIGGGISGLSALHFLRSRYQDKCRVVLYERDERLGGTIGTDIVGGFVSDWGPNGFLDRVPLTLNMVSELGAEDLLEPARNSAGKRYIFNRGKLHEISASPVAFMRSPLLSLKGRLRLAAEPFIRPRKDWDRDESIFDFAARRIGREAAATMIDSMVSGIFGGDSRHLSLAACFPIMKAMEKEHGSLVKALVARKRAAGKSKDKTSTGPAGPAGRLTSFKNGLATIIDVFAERYGDAITTGCPIIEIAKAENGYRVVRKGGSAVEFDAVICAAPAYQASSMIGGINASLSVLLDSIPYASIAVVCLGYQRQDIGHDLDGFGFLIPRGQGKRILGSIWTSSIFPGRSPDGMVQLRTMIGGATDSEAVELTDGALLDMVTEDLKPILCIAGPPAYVRIFRYKQGIPQFVIGHPARMEEMNNLLRGHPGLYFTGNAYEGVGLNDCVVRSENVVTELARYFHLI